MNCYNCGIKISIDNWSVEHIINRSIGGHLTSRNLLCRTCNSTFGSTIDAALNKQLSDFGFHLNIKLQGGYHEGFRTLSTIDGKLRRVGPGMIPYDQIRIQEVEKVIEFPVAPERFHSEMARKKRELEKKGIYEGSEYLIQPTKEKYFILSENATSPDEFAFGGVQCFRSIAKICLNFSLLKKVHIKYCEEVLSYVKGNSDNLDISFYYPNNEVIHKLGDQEVSHIVHLRGDREQNVIYAYIELFNVAQMIVPFSFSYKEEDFNYTYSWDLLNASELDKNLHLRLVRHHLEDLPLSSQLMAQRMGPARNRLLQIIEKRSISRNVELGES